MADQFDVQALIVTQELPVRAERLEGDRAPESLRPGTVCLGLFLGPQLVSRFEVDLEDEEAIGRKGFFGEPRRLVLYGMAYPPGVQGRLMALIPETLIADAEPWEADSQSYERETSDQGEGPLAELLAGMRQLPVGDLVRYDAMRKFPDDLAAELADMLANAVHRGAQDIVDHALAAMEHEFGASTHGDAPNDGEEKEDGKEEEEERRRRRKRRLRPDRARLHLFGRQAVDGRRRHPAYGEHEIELPAVVGLMFQVGPEPFPDRDRRPRGCLALLHHAPIAQARELFAGLGVQVVIVRQRRREPLGQPGPMPGIPRWPPLHRLGVHEPLDAGQMPDQAAHREPSRFRRPLDVAGRDQHDNAARPGMDAVQLVEKRQ